MKYLKLYENFDNRIDEMILYLKDILSDIEDEGFHVDLESHREKGIIHIYIYKPLKRENDPFKFSEIKEAYDRIIIFTRDYGWVPFYQVFPRFKLATEREIDKTIIPNENEIIYYAEFIFKVEDEETNEGLFDFFKKKKEVNNDNTFDIGIIQDLLQSDLDDVKVSIETESFSGRKYKIVEVLSIIKFENCRFKGSEGNPKLKRDSNWFGDEVSYSSTGHRGGIDGILLYYDKEELNKIKVDIDYLSLRDVYYITKMIYNKINKDRMSEYGIGYCINNHHYIGDGIVFYKL